MTGLNGMIFAAGFGTRLKPWTDEHPKALVRVGGRPMLERVIDKMKTAGAERIIINTHHFAEQIECFLRDNNNFGMDICISHEPELLDTGGGVAQALRKFGILGPMLVHNADILTDFPLELMIDAYRMGGSKTQLLVSGRSTSRYLLFDNSENMAGWLNPTTGEVRGPAKEMAGVEELHPLAFGGVHLLSRDVQQRLMDASGRWPEAFSIIDFYIDICSHVDLRAFQPRERYLWHDVGTSQKLATADSAWQNKYGSSRV